MSINTYISEIQILIVGVVFCLPMLKTAITFTYLKSTGIQNMLRFHGASSFQIYGAHLVYSSIYIIAGAVVAAGICYGIGNEQATFNPVLAGLYLFDIGICSVVLGIVIAQFTADKKVAAFFASMLIVFSMFIALFLLNNNFILVVLPQTFALHRLMVLSHTTVHEWCNLFIPLFIAMCYYFIIIVSQKNMFDRVVSLDFQN